MIQSPLHLKNYFVTKLSVKANASGEGSQLDGGVNTQTQVQTAQHKDNKRNWKVSLQIVCAPVEQNLCAYFIETELVGIFEVDNALPEEKMADIVTANAPALLYSAARELILLITGRGPFPPFLLPSVTFIDEAPSLKKKQAAAFQPTTISA